jgi:hypothetical protein
MTADARRRLKSTADNANMEMETIHDTAFVGNMEGLLYVRQAKESDLRQERLSNVEKRLTDVTKRLSDIEARIVSLEESVGFYGILRNRFLSTFKRDKLKNATPADIRLIADGKVWAHKGNASRDADLYQSVGGRTDFSTYKALYGLHPAVVREISKLIFEAK